MSWQHGNPLKSLVRKGEFDVRPGIKNLQRSLTESTRRRETQRNRFQGHHHTNRNAEYGQRSTVDRSCKKRIESHPITGPTRRHGTSPFASCHATGPLNCSLKTWSPLRFLPSPLLFHLDDPSLNLCRRLRSTRNVFWPRLELVNNVEVTHEAWFS